MGVYNNYATGYREVIFLVPEVDYGVPVHPSPTHAAQFLTADLSVTHERVNRNDKTSFRSYRERISHRKSGSWSMNLYVLPSGNNTVAPDITDALERGFGTVRVVPDGVAAASGSTTTVVAMATGTGDDYEINDGIGILNAIGELEVSFVTEVDGDDLTVSPAFSVAPGAAATIYGSVTYKLNNVLSSLTLTRILDNVTTVYTGAFVNDIAFDFPGDAEATLTVGGGCKEEWASGVSELAGAMLIGATSFTVPEGHAYRFEKNTRVELNAEGANTSEVVLITNVNYDTDTITVTRAQAGTAASAHGIGAVVGPYEPTLTVAGSPITGTKGEFVITGPNGVRDKHETTAHGLTIGNNANLRNNAIGQESATGFFSTGKRDVGFSVTLWLTKEKMAYYNKAKQFVLQEVLMQWGKEVGKSWAAKVPNAEFNIPAIDGGGDDEVMLSFTGIGLATAAGNDECIACYI
jgi:hypothetical protein